MSPNDLASWSLTEVAQAIQGRVVSAEEATRACLSRYQAWGPLLNCFISLDAERALETARKRDVELAHGRLLGPLHGVPMAHKDIFMRIGYVTTAGSPILKDFRATVNATVMDRLDAAGAINLGSLNMSEFAIGPTGHNQHFGDCCNPWSTAHISGGSSSGSAAAVAARIVYGSLGTDTGGSIRGPASNCAVVGLKPSYGRVSRHGVIPRSWAMDCVGPLARTVRDCARILNVIAGTDSRDSTSRRESGVDYEADLVAGIKGMRIVAFSNLDLGSVTPEVQGALDKAIEVFKELGAEVRYDSMPDLTRLYALGDTILKCEGSAIHRRWLHKQPENYSVHARARLDAGFYISSTRYIEALALRKLMLQEFLDTVLANADVLISPCIGFPTPTRQETEDNSSNDVGRTVSRLTAFTRPYSYLGLPSLSVPCAMSASGLPIAFQLIGHPFDEACLFRAGHAYQEATNWHLNEPIRSSAV